MITRIAVSQRIDVIPEYGENRDALDQRWFDFCLAVSVMPVILPNNAALAADILDHTPIDGALLTGGNSIGQNCDTPDRDMVETLLIEKCLARQRPIIGVCHGFQKLVAFFGGSIANIKGHVGTAHDILFSNTGEKRRVNSYHNQGIAALPATWSAGAISVTDDTVEMAMDTEYKCLGLMWHPERTEPFHDDDVALFKSWWHT